MSRKKFNFKITSAVFVVCLIAAFAPFASVFGRIAVRAAYAADDAISGGDGTYSARINYDLKMGADNFSDPVTIEKQHGKYYLTLGYSSVIGYFRLDLEGKEVGKMSEKKGGWTYYTYTLSESNLKSKLSISAYINAMSREMSFGATIDLKSAEKTSETVRNLGERPAEFVPVISTNAAAEYSLRVGTVFPIPEATANLGGEDCSVEVTASFGGAAAEISDGKLFLNSVGTYKLTYKAVNARYKTSFGNDSFSEYVVTINSVAGENELVKLNDPENMLPEKSGVVAGKMSVGSEIYEKAASAMKKIADEFEVFSVDIYDGNGDVLTPDGKIELMFRADDYFDRTKAEVYYMDENGNLTKLPARGYGRYVVAETDKSGAFIVCVPGVAFRMPMWGYALVLAGVLVVVAAVVFVVVRAAKRRKTDL